MVEVLKSSQICEGVERVSVSEDLAIDTRRLSAVFNVHFERDEEREYEVDDREDDQYDDRRDKPSDQLLFALYSITKPENV